MEYLFGLPCALGNICTGLGCSVSVLLRYTWGVLHCVLNLARCCPRTPHLKKFHVLECIKASDSDSNSVFLVYFPQFLPQFNPGQFPTVSLLSYNSYQPWRVKASLEPWDANQVHLFDLIRGERVWSLPSLVFWIPSYRQLCYHRGSDSQLSLDDSDSDYSYDLDSESNTDSDWFVTLTGTFSFSVFILLQTGITKWIVFLQNIHFIQCKRSSTTRVAELIEPKKKKILLHSFMWLVLPAPLFLWPGLQLWIWPWFSL